jgi:hypothetical protein
MTPTSVTDAAGAGSCASLLRDVSRRLTHELNNAANGVAVNLEVVRTRTAPSEGAHAAGPFAERASEQFEKVTQLHEILRSLLLLTIESLDERTLSCRLSRSGDEFEITFAGAIIPRGLRAEGSGSGPITLRNSPQGVILSVPRNPSSSE